MCGKSNVVRLGIAFGPILTETIIPSFIQPLFGPGEARDFKGFSSYDS